MQGENKPLFTNRKTESDGQVYIYEYFDSTDFDELPQDRIKQAYGVCFCDDKMVIGYGGLKKGWGLIGGSVEKEEFYEQTLIREIREESNMEVLSFIPIGFQKLTNTENEKVIYQLRYACKVRPYGEFSIDGGDGITEKGITEIRLINPETYKDYFDWGEIGDFIINKAIRLKDQFE